MKVLTAWVATVLVRFNAMISLLKGVSTYIVPCLFLQRKTKIGSNLHKGSTTAVLGPSTLKTALLRGCGRSESDVGGESVLKVRQRFLNQLAMGQSN